MERFTATCQRFHVPGWVAPLLQAASGLQSDRQRRRKVYRLIRHRLWQAGVGLSQTSRPTYVYPPVLKELIRLVFPEGVCDYRDPLTPQVVLVTLEDLRLVESKRDPVRSATETSEPTEPASALPVCPLLEKQGTTEGEKNIIHLSECTLINMITGPSL